MESLKLTGKMSDVRIKVALAVFVVAGLNGMAWSLLTPAFQVPDETAHFAYSQRLAESGIRAGDAGRPEFSTEQIQAMNAIGTLQIIGRPLNRSPSDESRGALADAELSRAESQARRDDGGGPSTASAQPPLYYALMAAPYRLFSSSPVTVRLQAMRFVSVLIFALGAGLCALFVSELLPGRPGPALVGGLAVALSPYTAFVSSGVNPDALLLTVSAATLLVLARMSRRGLTAERAAGLGILLSAGAMTKLTFLAVLVPGIVALLLLIVRDRNMLRRRGESPWLLIAAFTAGSVILPAVFLVWLAFTGRALLPAGTTTTALAGVNERAASNQELISYTWQLLLPRLPFMNPQFDYFPLRDIWLEGFAGRYGWLDYNAPSWLGTVFTALAGVAAALVAYLAIVQRKVMHTRWLEVVVGATFVVSLALVVGKAGYDYRRTTGFIFEQPRYLFPLAAFYALAIGLASSVGARRGISYATAGVIGLFWLHNISGLALTLSRYYG